MALLWRRFERALPNITRERLRVLNKWLFWLWLCPGIPISIYLRNGVAWVVGLSVCAIIIAHLIEWRQEAERSSTAQAVATRSRERCARLLGDCRAYRRS